MENEFTDWLQCRKKSLKLNKIAALLGGGDFSDPSCEIGSTLYHTVHGSRLELGLIEITFILVCIQYFRNSEGGCNFHPVGTPLDNYTVSSNLWKVS